MMLSSTPALPALWLSRLALPLGWAVVLGWCGLVLWQRGNPARVKGLWLAVLLPAASAFLPGEWSSAYWLGLPFQQPSLSAVLMCALGLYRGLQRTPAPAVAPVGEATPPRCTLALMAAGALLGWVLLLDTFALLPWPVYGWGFGPALLGLLLSLALGLWLISPRSWMPALVLVTYALTRLPSGNVWDALLDPLLWLALHGLLLRALWRRWHP